MNNGKEHGNYRGVIWGLDRGYRGIMEKTMEIAGSILG